MAFELKISKDLMKEEKYILLQSQIVSLIEQEKNLIANLANITAALKQSFEDFLWVGFYLLDEDKNELVLGPFQGNTACTRIPAGKGVCGTAAAEKTSLVVDDVNLFPGHIACDPASRSEIVIPVICNGKLKGVLDIDSDKISAFDDTDKMFLEKIVNNFSYILE
jgi:L-methionine (R)-S-oxide reductase